MMTKKNQEGPNNEKRYRCYRLFVKQVYNINLGISDRIELSSCFELAVKFRYPEIEAANMSVSNVVLVENY